MSSPSSARLRWLLSHAHSGTSRLPLETPCAHDGLSARLIRSAGFDAAFLSGFGVAAARGLPDAGYAALGETAHAAREVVRAVRDALPGVRFGFGFAAGAGAGAGAKAAADFPVIADADTGYGNAANVWSTVAALSEAGVAGIMIEDQVAPKRCGHVKGKDVVARAEAVARVAAACRARDAQGTNVVIVARTDARGVPGLGMEEALARARAFRDVGADVTFVEAPESEAELQRIGAQDDGWKMANMLLGGKTPAVPPATLKEWGFTLAAYPFDLLVPSIAAMRHALAELRAGRRPSLQPHDVDALWDVVGFREYLSRDERAWTAAASPPPSTKTN